MVQKYSIIAILLLLLQNCISSQQDFPDIPAIKLAKVEQMKFKGKDSFVNIVMTYTDGDGDIGLNVEDTFPPYQYGTKYFYNLFIDVYAVENGKAAKIPIPLSTDTINFNDRIANLTPTGKSKSISGELRITLLAKPYPGVLPDSMFYTFRIADRSLNESNTLTTPVMKFVF